MKETIAAVEIRQLYMLVCLILSGWMLHIYIYQAEPTFSGSFEKLVIIYIYGDVRVKTSKSKNNVVAGVKDVF